jgi:pyridoxine 4-dehydrogenase
LPRTTHRESSDTVRLGNTEIRRIGLGTNRLRDTEEDVVFIRAAVGAGIQMIDTAHLYTGGDSEKAIGRALSPGSSSVVVATKGGYGDTGRGKPEILRQEIEQSFASLGVDRIALYYLHRVDPTTPIEESLGAIKEYVDRGAIEHVGVSKVDVSLIERARKVVPIAVVQNEYNLAKRAYDDEIDYCEREGIIFVPYFPLHADPSNVLLEIAKKHAATPRQIMLAWMLKRSPAMLPIPGTLSLEHLRENLEVLSIELSDTEFGNISTS